MKRRFLIFGIMLTIVALFGAGNASAQVSYESVCKPNVSTTANSTFVSNAEIINATGVEGAIDMSGISKSISQKGATPEIKAVAGATFSIKYTFTCNWNNQVVFMIENTNTDSPAQKYGSYSNSWPGDGTHGTKTALYNMAGTGITVDMDASTAIFPFTVSSSLRPGDLVVIRHIVATEDPITPCGTVTQATYLDIPIRIYDPADDSKYTVSVSSNIAAGGNLTIDGASVSSKEVNAYGTCTLSAAVNSDYIFTNWTKNGVVVSTVATYNTGAIMANSNYVANFTKEPKLSRTGWTATASDQESGSSADGPASQAIDGDLTKWWHSKYTGGTPAYPHWIMFDCGKSVEFTSFNYISRNGLSTAGNGNGNIAQYELYASDTESDVKSYLASAKVNSGTFTYDGTTSPMEHKIDLGTTAKGRYVLLKAVSSANSAAFAACNEFYLYYEAAAQYEVAAVAAPIAGGDVTINGKISPQNINEGSKATFQATASAGYKFVNWTNAGGAVSTANPYEIAYVSEAVSLTANFITVPSVRVSVSSNDNSLGAAAYTHSGSGSEVYEGENVTFTATAVAPGLFVNWTNAEGAEVSTANPYTMTSVNADVALVANFIKSYPVMTYCYTNNIGQSNRYLKSVTATQGSNITEVFNAASESELPREDYDGAFSESGSSTKGALVDKTATPIVVEQGTTSFTVNFKGWSTNMILGGTSKATEIDWTQQALYVDWNNNYLFTDAGENQGKNGDTCPNAAFKSADGYTRTVTVPADQAPGTYRMRVSYFEPSGVYTEAWDQTLFTTKGNKTRNGKSYDFIIKIVAKVAHSVSVSSSPTEGGIVRVNGVAGPVDVSEGSTASLVASYNEGYYFVNWTVDGIEVSREHSFTSAPITKATNFVANFLPKTQKEIKSNETETGNTNYTDVKIEKGSGAAPVWTIGSYDVIADKLEIKIETDGTTPQVDLTSGTLAAVNISVNRVVKSGQWALLTLPFDINLSDITVDGHPAVYGTNIRIQYYDAAYRAANSRENWTVSGWKEQTSGSISANHGFAVSINGNNGNEQTVTFTARSKTFNGTDKTLTLDRHNSSVNKGADADWNFCGNPTLLNATKGEGYSLYVYNAATNSYEEYSGAESATYAPFTSWFVQSADDFQSMTFRHGSPVGKMLSADNDYSKLILSINGDEDQAKIIVKEGSNNNYQKNEDAMYFAPLNQTLSQLYLIDQNGDRIASSVVPSVYQTVKVAYKAGVSGTQTITLTSQPSNSVVTLKDNQAGTQVQLSEGDSYEFTSGAGLNESRFELQTLTDVTGVEDAITDGGNIKVAVSGDQIIILGTVEGDTIKVISANGSELMSVASQDGSTTILSSAQGLLIIKVGSVAVKIVK